MKVKILAHTPNPEKIVAMAGKLCYSPSSIDDLEENLTDEKIQSFIDKFMSYGHESVLEHVTFVFAVEGISRSLSHQLVRHRIASYCLTGDTIVGYDNKVKGMTIEELYNKPKQYQDIIKLRSINENTQEILMNNIENIVYSGEKDVYEVKTEDGYSIKSTKKHKFLTSTGWKRLEEIKEGDCVFTNGQEAYKNKIWLEEMYHKLNLSQQEIADKCGVSKHTIRKRIAKFNLQKNPGSWSIGVAPSNKGKTKENYKPMQIVSEKMKGNHNNRDISGKNNPSYVENRNDLTISGGYYRTHKVKSKTGVCEFCNKKGYTEIHHIDKNPKNYNSENLIELCEECHKIQHKGFSVKCVKLSKITSITYIGKEKTYDIEMKAPYHNFIANGFVVHNSQQSQRYVKEGDNFDFIIPQVINDMGTQAWLDYTRDMETIHKMYLDWQSRIKEFVEATNYPTYGMSAEKVANENARYVLPNACETKIIITMNVRSLYNFFNKRCCNRAQQEIRDLANEMLKQVREVAPKLFVKAGASCTYGECKEGKMSCKNPIK